MRAIVAGLALPLRQSRAVSVASLACAGHLVIDGESKFPHLVKVGSQQPPPLSRERCAQVSRTEAESRRDSEAHCRKVGEGLLKGSKADVLEECIAGSNLSDDAGHLGPQVARVLSAEPLAGATPRLAGEAAGHNVDTAAPSGAVERAHVLENRERRQQALELPGLEHLAAVGVNLDGTDALVPQQQAAKDAAADAGE